MYSADHPPNYVVGRDLTPQRRLILSQQDQIQLMVWALPKTDNPVGEPVGINAATVTTPNLSSAYGPDSTRLQMFGRYDAKANE